MKAADDRGSRYRVLESVAAYARDQLSQQDQLRRLRLQHAQWCLEYAAAAEIRRNETPRHAWIAPLRDEMDNFRAALDFCLQGSAPELGARLACALNSPFKEMAPREGLRWLESAVAALPASADPVRFAELYMAIGTYDGIVETKLTRIEAIERALAIYESVGSGSGSARARQLLAIAYISDVECSNENLDYAFRIAEKNLDFFQAHGTVFELETALSQYGLAAGFAGHDDARHRAFAESLAVSQSPDPEEGLARVSAFNAFIETRRGNAAGARTYWQEALEIYERSPGIRGIQHMRALQGVAETSFQLGDPHAASHAQPRALELAVGQEEFYGIGALSVAMYARAANGEYETATALFGFLTANGDRSFAKIPRETLLARLHAHVSAERFARLYKQGAAMSIASAKAALEVNPL